MDWQPIETAPKDGIEILVSDGVDVYVAHFAANARPECCWQTPYGGNGSDLVTHWMPLPEPPKESD